MQFDVPVQSRGLVVAVLFLFVLGSLAPLAWMVEERFIAILLGIAAAISLLAAWGNFGSRVRIVDDKIQLMSRKVVVFSAPLSEMVVQEHAGGLLVFEAISGYRFAVSVRRLTSDQKAWLMRQVNSRGPRP